MGCKMPWWAGSETPPPDKDKIIDDLRAEVVSLKELNKLDKEVHSKMPELVGEIAHLTQQLAAAHERIKYLETLWS